MTDRRDVNDLLRAGKLPDSPMTGKRINGEQPIDPDDPRFSEEPGEEGKPYATWVRGSEIWEPLPPIPWVVEGLHITAGRPTIIAGYGYSGKSVVAQAMALQLAAGRPVWGKYSPPHAMRVAHLDYEQGMRATKRRYQRLAFADAIFPAEVEDRLQFACFPSISLTNPEFEEWIERETTGIEFCFLDSLRALTPGVDENDSIISSHIGKLSRVSERNGCAFTLLHHAGKTKASNGAKGSVKNDSRELLRGSSAIFDAAGTVVVVELQDSPGGGAALIKTTMVKSTADAEGGKIDPFVLRISDVADDDATNMRAGLRVQWQELEEDKVPETHDAAMGKLQWRIRQVLKKHPGITTNSVIGLTDGRRQNIMAALELLEAAQVVTRKPGANRSTLWFLSATDQAEDS